MSALDRLYNYSARDSLSGKQQVEQTVVDNTQNMIDTTTKGGMFLSRLHNAGYSMYVTQYKNTETNEIISKTCYDSLDITERNRFQEFLDYTELYRVITTDGNLVIKAIAGAGKTSALTFKVLYDLVSGKITHKINLQGGSTVEVADKVWVCTFLKSGTEELENSVAKWQRQLCPGLSLGQIVFSTLDAEFKRCVNAMGVATHIGDNAVLTRMLNRAIDACVTSPNGRLEKEDYTAIGSIIKYTRGRLDNRKYLHPSCESYRLTKTIIDSIISQYASLKNAEGIMDFEDILELLYKYLYETPNPKVQDFVSDRFKYIYIDEFQDTSQMQYAVLKFYARGHLKENVLKKDKNDGCYTGVETDGKIVAVGDISQCVSEDTCVTVRQSDDKVVKKEVKSVEETDRLLSAIGNGRYGFVDIENIHKTKYIGTLIKIHTKSGKTLRVTPEHKLFIQSDRFVGEKYYVYLIYRNTFGFSIGMKKCNLCDLRTQLQKEKGNKLWVLFELDEEETANYWKSYYSYDYGIPDISFVDTEFMSRENLQKLYNSLGTDINGKTLLGKHQLLFDFPLFVETKSFKEDRVVALNEVIFGGDICEDYSDSVLYNKDGALVNNTDNKIYYMQKHSCFEIERLENDVIDDFQVDGVKDTLVNINRMARLIEVSDENDVFMQENLFSVVTASTILNGMFLCSFDENMLVSDEVVSVISEHYNGYVYDFDIPTVRNYIANNVVVHNCIYSFKGADSSVLGVSYDADFMPTHCDLSYNWRCPSNILNPIVNSIHKNKDSANQKILPSKEGGEFYAYHFNDIRQMVQQLKEDVAKDISEGLSVAILCRTNFDGLIPALALEEDHRVNFSVSGNNMTLESTLPRKLMGITSLFTERSTQTVRQSLQLLVPFGAYWEIKTLVDVLKLNNIAIWDVPEADMKHSAPELASTIADIKSKFYVNGKRVKEKEIEALNYTYDLLYRSFRGRTAYAESARAYITMLKYTLANGNYKTVYDFLEELDYLREKLNSRVNNGMAKVKISTVHEFKGKESDSVYIWNDSNGVFPSYKCNMGVEAEVEEERRVHYIACTRARKREHIYTLLSKMGKFVLEMKVNTENPIKMGVSLGKQT